MPDTSHLTPRAREVFQTYLNQGQRDIDQTATLVGMHQNHVEAMVERYGFVEMARDSDMQRVMALAAYTRRKLAEQLPVFADTLIASATSRTTEAGNTPSSAPTPSSVKSALAGLAMFGLSPLTRSDVALIRPHGSDGELGRIPDDALVARLIEAGDTVALTALAAGRPLPHGADQAPGDPVAGGARGDFTSDQPGGRVGSDPLNPLFEGPEPSYRVLSDEEWRGEQAGGEEFVFGEQPGE